MKKYKPIDEVISVYDVPKELWESESLMKEKPNWNKTNYTESEKIYQNKEFIILKVKSNKKIGFIVYNTKKEWENGHSHLNSRTIAEIVIKNVIYKRKPKTNNLYVLKSHARVSDDKRYIKFIEDLIKVKKSKTKNNYINKKGGRK